MLKTDRTLENISSLEPYQIPFRFDLNSSRIRNSHSLGSVKKSRKLIDAEAQALANKVSILQKEEEKIWRNIDIAKVKAGGLVRVKRTSVVRDFEKLSRVEESQPSSQRNGDSTFFLKHREQGIKGIKEIIQKLKHEEMLAVKKQSQILMQKRQSFDEQIQFDKQKKMLDIKKEEILSSLKKKAYYHKKVEKIRQKQQEKVNDEEEYKLTKELEILNLEKAEMEAMQKIQKARSLQKEFYKKVIPMLTEPCEITIPISRGSNNLSVIQSRSRSVKDISFCRKNVNESMNKDRSIERSYAKGIKNENFLAYHL